MKIHTLNIERIP